MSPRHCSILEIKSHWMKFKTQSSLSMNVCNHIHPSKSSSIYSYWRRVQSDATSRDDHRIISKACRRTASNSFSSRSLAPWSCTARHTARRRRRVKKTAVFILFSLFLQQRGPTISATVSSAILLQYSI